MKTTPTPTGVKFIRWMLNSVPPAAYANAVGFKGRVDRLEAQQARLQGSPNPPLVDIDADGTRIQARRCLKRRIAEEAIVLAAN